MTTETIGQQQHLDLILSMRNGGLANYAIPGLDSHLIGGKGAGMVRLFQCSRQHQEQITPHSHRFDFSALVLRGCVRNILWGESEAPGEGDEFLVSTMIYGGKPGEYATGTQKVKSMAISDCHFHQVGDWYHMKAHEIHSIEFSRDAAVLFFEGPQVSETSVILEPHINGETTHTFEVKPWMFRKM